MIHAFNFTCARDFELAGLMMDTLKSHLPSCRITSWMTETGPYKGYGNGSGWPQSMMKLDAMRQVAKEVRDNDFILSVDSDVVFTSPEVFKHIDPQYGIIGTKHRPEFRTHLGKWSHMSGAAIFIRGDIAKLMGNLRESELTHIRWDHFKKFNLTENEDVVLSYLASYVGGMQFDLGTIPGLSSGNFESDVAKKAIKDGDMKGYFVGEQKMASFYHLNYCPTTFLGEPVSGKWDIPKVLKMKGIELC